MVFNSYDSTKDTMKHKENVKQFMTQLAQDILSRAECHDNSKLCSPEKEIFDEYTPKLKTTTYGSDEYKEHLKGMDVGLKHHHSNNRHHPEYHEHMVFIP